MILMGCDYEYENAAVWYSNMDRLIDAVNKDGRVYAKLLDPATYTAAKKAENLTWSVKEDDFMPCAQEWTEESGLRGHMYWAGYFTSRPALKRLQRVSSSYLQATNQMHSLTMGQTPPVPTDAWSPFTGSGLALLPPPLPSLHTTMPSPAPQGSMSQTIMHGASQGTSIADVVTSDSLRTLVGAPAKTTFELCHLLNETIATRQLKASPHRPTVYSSSRTIPPANQPQQCYAYLYTTQPSIPSLYSKRALTNQRNGSLSSHQHRLRARCRGRPPPIRRTANLPTARSSSRRHFLRSVGALSN